MKRGLWAFAVGTAIAAFGSATMAGNISYDASLASPPGWYNGTGNPNGGFTIDNESNGIEVGLRAKLRQNPNVINSSTNVYQVPAGPQPGAPTRAAWNYEFSINLGSSGFTLADIQHSTLTITDITTGGTPQTVNLLTYWSDNSTYSNGNAVVGAQNSQNPAFTGATGFPLQGTYNEFAPDTYEFTLKVKNDNNNDAVLAQDTIDVTVAPVPSSLWAGIALMGGLGIVVATKRLRGQAAI
jgi:hypothetical protein